MKEQESYLQVDGQRVKVCLFTPALFTKKKAVLFLHGWTGKPNNRAAKVLAEAGYITLTVVFRGHEGSDGSMKLITRQNALDDAKTAYDFLRESVGQGIPIVVTGSSYGGYTAAVLCAERDLSAVSLRVPANYPDEGFDEPQYGKGHEDPRIASWRSRALPANSTRSLRAIQSFEGQIQIFEAELDQLVPHQTVQNYADAVKDQNRLEHLFMKGWPHSLGDHEENNKQYQTLLLQWLEKL